ncbi:hypothetical protein NEAUS04_1251 [Nematocida ausubeli]|uniref:Uncharacterized protein n=1 Tax=Nematocida ausubeli (strain ATCC PRA-371 / ERTm2) TaxID=1913371 RepID=H8ZAQ0_NEMA1|nr:uncharacterized protein NESG_01499 [Nematocida ausubeli]EHY65953.1 hypothetical protein NERG_00649 [Nematocida ausubeli]KAI5132022.1 hypothetical protein NEAUS07_0021 [Nematocida ausubeli]KAI5134049.1 hypothetical protein NEAUS06_0883 [Nematocida ausubeli]KAI5147816.1 hypothetical protein NEAUS05_1097 [Nematocida ausubeli]KAI5162935.1 hypothetical protein NEAUS04_1251 [Nematocida ausubeli]
MFTFIAIGLLIPLCVAFYIRRTRKEMKIEMLSYDNKYLKEYLDLPSESTQLDQYKVLAKASIYLIEKESEIEDESKMIYSLFYSRMISSTLWNHLKKIKEELNLDKITVEAELGRFSKIDKSSADIITAEKYKKSVVDAPCKEKMTGYISESARDKLYLRLKEKESL